MTPNRTRSPRSVVRVTTILALLAVLVLAACGGSSSPNGTATAGKGGGDLTVSAATSLKQAFTRYGAAFTAATARFSFAGSDQLAAQIQQGVKPDVFASANTTLPDQLHAKGLVEQPTVFAANRLVIAVPAHGAKVHGIADLAKPGVTIAIGSPTVPIGTYTRTVLARLGNSESAAILKNVRSNEPDVGGVIGKVAEGAVDAGFVYVTDVQGAGGKVAAVDLPAAVQPRVAYGVAVVKGSPHAAAARQFIAGLLDGTGANALREAGFEPPPAK